jgi:hypothetical protein
MNTLQTEFATLYEEMEAKKNDSSTLGTPPLSLSPLSCLSLSLLCPLLTPLSPSSLSESNLLSDWNGMKVSLTALLLIG